MAYQYRLDVALTCRTSGQSDPSINFPGVLVPADLCALVAKMPMELSSQAPLSGMDAATRSTAVWNLCHEAIALSAGDSAVPTFEIEIAPDPSIASSDYNVGTPDKPIWKPYDDGMGVTLIARVAPTPSSGAGAPIPPYPRVQVVHGIAAAWFLHCKLSYLGES
ncbi:MAG: hypothetical protein IPN34_19780 [Planctomycetes bacterium]|nr:hypothetical protein [Planctomycetota bacterium]